MTCWINGGQVNGTCGGYVYSCCKYNKSQRQGQQLKPQTYAQPRKLEFWDDFEVNNIETLQDVHYGPVRNDPVCGLQRISRRRIVGRVPRLVGKSPKSLTFKKKETFGAILNNVRASLEH